MCVCKMGASDIGSEKTSRSEEEHRHLTGFEQKRSIADKEKNMAKAA